jgi:hypothetical protein
MIGRTTQVNAMPLEPMLPPQWSRPRIGRMTSTTVRDVTGALVPQWSQPRIGRTTTPTVGKVVVTPQPQWSRRGDWPDDAPAHSGQRYWRHAAMEPAEGTGRMT